MSLVISVLCMWAFVFGQRRPRRGRSKRRRRRTNPCAWVLFFRFNNHWSGRPMTAFDWICEWFSAIWNPEFHLVLLFLLAFGQLLLEGGKVERWVGGNTPVKQCQINRRKRELAVFQGRRWSIDGPRKSDDVFFELFNLMVPAWKWRGTF